MKIEEKIKILNKSVKTNWEIRFHGDLVDINYPDSGSPDYEDYESLEEALDAVLEDINN